MAITTACAAGAQSPLREFSRLFEKAVVDCAKAVDADEFRAAHALFLRAGELIDQLPADKRGQARFFVDVREAELFDFSRDGKRALELALAARTRALAAPPGGKGKPVYTGSYRVRLLHLLWNNMTDHDFHLWLVENGAEVAFLHDSETDAELRKPRNELFVPYRLLRCAILSRDGEDRDAFRLLQETSEQMKHRPGTPRDWRDKCMMSMAWHFLEQQDLARAEVALRDVESDRAKKLQVFIALRRGDYPTAEQLALPLAEKDPVYNHMLGEAIELQGRYEEALGVYARALKAHDAAGSVVNRAVTLNSMGDCHLNRGELDQAQQRFESALAVLDSVPSRFQQGERCLYLSDLGRLFETRGDPGAAYEKHAAALEAIEARRRAIPVDWLGSSWLGGNFLSFAVEGVLRTHAGAGHGPFAALAALERGKARGLLDWIHTRPVAGEGLKALRGAVRQLALTADPAQLEERQRHLEQVRRLSERAGLRSAGTLAAEQIREVVRAEPRSLFLSYWVGRETTWLVWARGAVVESVVLGTREEARGHLRRAYEAVADREPDPWPALAEAASFFVPQAIAAQLDGAERVVFCPDGVLSRLPFEALPVGGEPLGVRADVEWAPSLSVRQALATREPRGRGVVVVDSIEAPADVAASFAVEPLEFSAAEGDRVQAHYAGGQVPVERLRGREATLENLTATLQSTPAAVLHVNAHAIASPRVPSRSLLLLASGPESMASLANLPLAGALVVLAACSSATGEERGGEGVVGLLWGPMAAGARAVVASLWMVNQESTAELMARFHGYRAQGFDDAAALRQARGELASSSRYAHPYYWAGFVSHGSRSSNPVLVEPARWGSWTLAGICTLAIVGLLHWRTRRRRLAAPRAL